MVADVTTAHSEGVSESRDVLAPNPSPADIRAVARFCSRYADDPEAAADLAQEAWLRAIVQHASFRGDGSYLGWVCRIARTVAARHRRASRRGARARDDDSVVMQSNEERLGE